MRSLMVFGLVPMVSMAAGLPVTFQVGSGAKASEVNQNFRYLDSAVAEHEKQIAQKADQSAVLGMVSTVGAKVDTAALTARLGKYVLGTGLTSYATSTALTTGLGGKVDTAKFIAALGKEVDTATLTSRLADYAKVTALADYAKSTVLADYAKATALTGLATTSALTSGLAAKPDRSEVMVVGANGAVIPNSVSISGAYPYLKAGYSELSSGELRLYTDTMITKYGYPNWILTATSDAGFQVGRYGGGPTSNTYYLEILPGTGTTLRGAVKTTDSLVVGKNLRVAGKVFASVATITVPDYVFEPEYKLAPLSEVEAFARQNKHLPDVPSATEIGKGGLDITEMNLTLLRKVEELTLHAIAQEKQIQAQNERIQSLESRLGK